LSSDMEWVELGGEGEIETFTHIAVKPATFQSYDDYTIAIARLKEGVRVLAWLSGATLIETKVGMKVRLVAKTTSEGVLTYEFVPIQR
ncbi:MAG: OB-fold domain-containing protein, partial [Candidatus Bathyarchaeota archaeon]|nr:OB-fold domain-containing protein [Candidatus Bathyarchaeota archaeon]